MQGGEAAPRCKRARRSTGQRRATSARPRRCVAPAIWSGPRRASIAICRRPRLVAPRSIPHRRAAACRARPTGANVSSGLLSGRGDDSPAPANISRSSRRGLARARHRAQGDRVSRSSGVVNSVIDFGVFSFCYYYLGLPIIVANTIAWVVAVSGSYVMNSTITFAAESGRRLRLKGYLGFALSQISGLLRQHWNRVVPGRAPSHSGLGREGGRDRGQLRRQFFSLAFSGIPRAATPECRLTTGRRFHAV